MIKAIIFDYGGTLHEPGTNKLRRGAIKILDKLRKQNFKMALVSRAADIEARRQDFKRLKLDKYFQMIDIVPSGTPKDFLPIIKKFKVKPKEWLVIDDIPESGIKEGNKLGAITIWLKGGEFPELIPQTKEEQPNYIINSLDEIKALLSAQKMTEKLINHK